MKRVWIISMALLFAVSLAWSQIGHSPVASPTRVPYEKYVRALYKDVHSREGDVNGVKYWTDQLIQQKMTKEEVVKGFLNSKEYRERFVKNIYAWFHDRVPDETGLKYWTEYMKDHDEGDMIRNFVLAQEFWNHSNQDYRDWVENLYWTLQSRKPDQTGHNYWTKELKGGMSKEDVVGAFLKSNEYRERYIKFLYEWYHKRQPDDTGLKYWTGQLGELGERQIILNFLTGDEYWNRVIK